jgi:hypothetical protein
MSRSKLHAGEGGKFQLNFRIHETRADLVLMKGYLTRIDTDKSRDKL